MLLERATLDRLKSVTTLRLLSNEGCLPSGYNWPGPYAKTSRSIAMLLGTAVLASSLPSISSET
jgi:hypothetical protein